MKYRHSFFAGLAVASLAGTVGCDGHGFDHDRYSDSEIVFGINQSKAADGKVITSVGYEHLDVRDSGWSTRGFVSRDRSCWSERLDDRLGQPRVDGGVAKFEGGLLPAGGIAVVANRAEDLTLEGPAWTNAGDSLVFEAKGFAMPEITPAKLVLPSTGLTIVSPADAAAEVPVSLQTELEVAWDKGDASTTRENVVASIVATPEGQPDARGVELRCFFDRSAGTGRFPQKMMDRFATLVGPGAIKGKLRIATHRQLTILANGGWTVYVVATADQREQPFTLQR
jgi:hypothetical protein